MFEKVNPAHPDKIADRIAGALVDLAYKNQDNPQVAVEVLIGHGECYIISESSFMFRFQEVSEIVKRICPEVKHIFLNYHSQDKHLANNQAILRCGDNGIFKGTPITEEQSDLSKIARNIYNKYQSDGKYILDKEDDNKQVLAYIKQLKKCKEDQNKEVSKLLPGIIEQCENQINKKMIGL